MLQSLPPTTPSERPRDSDADNHSRYFGARIDICGGQAERQIIFGFSLRSAAQQEPIELQEERNGVFFLDSWTRKTAWFSITARSGGHRPGCFRGSRACAIQNNLIGFVRRTGVTRQVHSIKRLKLKAGDATAYTGLGF